MDLEAFPTTRGCRNLLERRLARVPQAFLRRGRAADDSMATPGLPTSIQMRTCRRWPSRPELANAGLGRQLLSVVLAEAIRHGASRCLLEVKIDNLPRDRAFTSVGFTELGTRPGYYREARRRWY